jgi:hypothetical protein
MERWCKNNNRGNPKYWGRSCPIAALPTTNDTSRQRRKQETKSRKMKKTGRKAGTGCRLRFSGKFKNSNKYLGCRCGVFEII